jgi:hypothetical protein
MRALDQAGDVGDHDRVVVDARHPEVRDQGGEGVVGDARARCRHRGDERRLPRVRIAHESHVGEQPQLEPQLARLARQAGLGAPRCPIRRRLEARIPPAAAAAVRHHDLRVGAVEIGDERVRLDVDDACSDRHAHHA